MQLNIWLIGDEDFIAIHQSELLDYGTEEIYNQYVGGSDEIIEIHKKEYRYAINRKAIAYMCLCEKD